MSFKPWHSLFKFTCVVLLHAAFTGLVQGQTTHIESTSEEHVYTYTSPNNGSGPLWGYGSSVIVRNQERVFICATETGVNVPPLCNTRWRILTKIGSSWQSWAEASHYRQREPCLMALSGNALILSVNDSLTEPGTHYKACQPHLKHLSVLGNGNHLKTLMPTWDEKAQFTDHSYRGLATDPSSNGILVLNIDAVSSEQNWAFMNPEGKTLNQGKITFPIRSCYPQVQVRESYAAVMAVSDIREPNETWATFKRKHTGREWDYVFRILYWTRNHLIEKDAFLAPVEIANVDATAGHISNQDLWVRENLDAWMLYGKQEVQSELMRAEFFPDKSTRTELWISNISKEGEIRWSRRIQPEPWKDGIPGWSRFHQTPDGKIWVLSFVAGSQAGNWITLIHPEGTVVSTEKVPFNEPFRNFLTTSHRNGHTPSNLLDLVGTQSNPLSLSHGRIEWANSSPLNRVD